MVQVGSSASLPSLERGASPRGHSDRFGDRALLARKRIIPVRARQTVPARAWLGIIAVHPRALAGATEQTARAHNHDSAHLRARGTSPAKDTA